MVSLMLFVVHFIKGLFVVHEREAKKHEFAGTWWYDNSRGKERGG